MMKRKEIMEKMKNLIESKGTKSYKQKSAVKRLNLGKWHLQLVTSRSSADFDFQCFTSGNAV